MLIAFSTNNVFLCHEILLVLESESESVFWARSRSPSFFSAGVEVWSLLNFLTLESKSHKKNHITECNTVQSLGISLGTFPTFPNFSSHSFLTHGFVRQSYVIKTAE